MSYRLHQALCALCSTISPAFRSASLKTDEDGENKWGKQENRRHDDIRTQCCIMSPRSVFALQIGVMLPQSLHMTNSLSAFSAAQFLVSRRRFFERI